MRNGRALLVTIYLLMKSIAFSSTSPWGVHRAWSSSASKLPHIPCKCFKWDFDFVKTFDVISLYDKVRFYWVGPMYLPCIIYGFWYTIYTQNMVHLSQIRLNNLDLVDKCGRDIYVQSIVSIPQNSHISCQLHWNEEDFFSISFYVIR